MMRKSVIILLASSVFFTLHVVADEKQKTDQKPVATNDETPPADSAPVEEKPTPTPPENDGRRPALTATMIVKVVNPDEAKAAIKKQAESLKGYLSYVDGHSIIVKVPPAKLSEVMAFTAEQGYVIEKTMGREELSLEIVDLNGRLKSKTEILKRLRSFFDDSDVAATLEIERNMTQLVQEIEYVTGRLRVLTDRADWAVLNISFQFRERDKVVYVQSPFEWLNTANLDQFLTEF